MTREEYNKAIEEQINICRDLLISKGKEYSTNDDPLHNFNAAAPLYSGDPKKVLGGYMLKHVTSVYDMIQSDDEYSIDKWTEKITDNINYLLILKAMIIDRLSSSADNTTPATGTTVQSTDDQRVVVNHPTVSLVNNKSGLILSEHDYTKIMGLMNKNPFGDTVSMLSDFAGPGVSVEIKDNKALASVKTDEITAMSDTLTHNASGLVD